MGGLDPPIQLSRGPKLDGRLKAAHDDLDLIFPLQNFFRVARKYRSLRCIYESIHRDAKISPRPPRLHVNPAVDKRTAKLFPNTP
jgi:hypothetical protein